MTKVSPWGVKGLARKFSPCWPALAEPLHSLSPAVVRYHFQIALGTDHRISGKGVTLPGSLSWSRSVAAWKTDWRWGKQQMGWEIRKTSSSKGGQGEGKQERCIHSINRIKWSSVQISCSVMSNSLRPMISARQASLSITISQSSLRLTSIELVMPSSHLILCRPLLLLPPIPPSIRVFPNESTLRMRWPKYGSFSFSIIPSKEYPGLISFRMD